MKILYGVQGTGNGHLTRARRMSKHLNDAGINVDYLFSGRAREKYFDMNSFGDWRCCDGLTFAVVEGSIRPMATMAQAKPLRFIKDIHALKLDDYDLIISDFEPISAWAAKKNNRYCLGIGHQYAFDYNIPVQGANPITRNIMRYFAPSSRGIGLHWYHFNQPILPPIVDICEQSFAMENDKIVVYLPFEKPEFVKTLLKPFKEYQFLYYGNFTKQTQEGNIQLNPVSRDAFQRDLARSHGVISNAGFELASEAISLGKKLLVKPLHGQMEQLSNGLALQQLKLGTSVHQLDVPAIRQWLDNFQAKQVIYPDVAKAIVEWIKRGDLDNHESMIADLWKQTDAKGLETFAPFDHLEAKQALA